MKVYCVYSLESPHWGDSNENTKYTIFNIKKKITLDYPKSAAMGYFSRGLKDEFETAMVNKLSVFKPLKFYCIKKFSKSVFFTSSSRARARYWSVKLWTCIYYHRPIIRSPSYEKKIMLNSAEHEILNARKYKNIKKFSLFQAQISLQC